MLRIHPMTVCVLILLGGMVSTPARAMRDTVTVFDRQMLHFNLLDSMLFVEPPAESRDVGRMVLLPVDLPDPGPDRVRANTRILGHLTLHPTPKDDRSVHDRWDRAGNVCLMVPDAPPLEVIRFMTAYGGETSHTLDLTHLSPLLWGTRTFRAFVDTWVSPGWSVSLDLEYIPDSTAHAPDWVMPAYYTKSFNAQDMPTRDSAPVVIPDGIERVVLSYISTGHCTDGRGADEFVSKPNVIAVDGTPVIRIHPWRDDCYDFRGLNPYGARWSEGVWSVDFSRSGWCPGDAVPPEFFDLTDLLTPGRHMIGFEILDMRTIDENGHFGYWRVSAAVSGWYDYPEIWTN